MQHDELEAEVTAVLAKVSAAERRGISGEYMANHRDNSHHPFTSVHTKNRQITQRDWS